MLWARAPCCESGWPNSDGGKTMKIAVLAGDGIGPEVTREAVRVLEALGLAGLELVHAVVGGAAYHQTGHPLPAETLDIARSSDAILFGAVGDPTCDSL